MPDIIWRGLVKTKITGINLMVSLENRIVFRAIYATITLDDKVTAVTTDDILKLYGGGDWHMAYLLIYKSKQLD
jgi:hypothetical protein